MVNPSFSLNAPKHGGLPSRQAFPLAVAISAALWLIYFFLLRQRVWHGYEAFTLQVELKSWMGPMTIPAFPILPVAFVLIAGICVSLLPFKGLRSSQAWRQYGPRLWLAAICFLWVPGLLALGSLVFYLVKEYLPKVAQALGSVLSVSLHLKLGGFEATPSFGIDGLIGAIVGLYLWKKFGFK